MFLGSLRFLASGAEHDIQSIVHLHRRRPRVAEQKGAKSMGHN
jgi:hypothetical protein